jgi:C_GCAxxG_C_C family probable redox protein
MALVEGLRLEMPFVPRMASALAGGMAGTHKYTCGILNAAAVVAGALIGRDHVTKEPAPAYLMMRQLFADFEQEYGTLCCHELVGVSPDLSPDDFLAQLKAKETRTRVCDGLKVFTIRRFFELLPEWE